MLFATPDFGAGGMVVLVLLGVSLAVLGLALGCIVRGMILLRRPASGRKWLGLLLILAGVLLPVTCCSGPSVLFRLHHETPPLGSYPNGVINEGMSADEVRALLGKPHQVYDRDPQRVSWLYYLDSLQVRWFKVDFGPDSKVTGTGGN